MATVLEPKYYRRAYPLESDLGKYCKEHPQGQALQRPRSGHTAGMCPPAPSRPPPPGADGWEALPLQVAAPGACGHRPPPGPGTSPAGLTGTRSQGEAARRLAGPQGLWLSASARTPPTHQGVHRLLMRNVHPVFD